MRQLYRKFITLFLIIIISLSALSAQPQSVSFDKMIHNFGDIALNSGSHRCKFTFTNRSDQPVVVQTVISSCGCTDLTWTKKPVMPGQKGSVEVTFLNDLGPYPFDKALSVYITGERRPIVLRVKGVVHAKPKTLRELFPYSFGAISLQSQKIDLGRVPKGEEVTQYIDIANTSNRSITLNFKSNSRALKLSVEPTSLKSGGKAILKVTLNSGEISGWGSHIYEIIPIVNGVEERVKSIPTHFSIRDNFFSLTKEQRDKAALPMATASRISLGEIKRGTIAKGQFQIRNIGQTDLIIRKGECGQRGVKIDHPTKIEPGKVGKIEATIDTSNLEGDNSWMITLITNSPQRPELNLIVTATIIK